MVNIKKKHFSYDDVVADQERLKQYEDVDFGQTFNYHTHTSRCGHAVVTDDRNYVLFARKNGITNLGFSDHIPSNELEFTDEKVKMFYFQMQDYIDSINALKKEFYDMNILVGFEAEFDPSKEHFLGECREKVDYMILGQHFVSGINSENNPNYPIHYAKMVCKAIDSGLFDYVAHPDIFMHRRDTIISEHDKQQFLENSKIACKMICERAKQMDIPLEVNFAGIEVDDICSDGELKYPHSMFWKEALVQDVKVVFGVDAHNPIMFDKLREYFSRALDIIPDNLNFLNNYNPVIARQNNDRLKQSYITGQKKALPYKVHLVNQLINQAVIRQKGFVDEDSDFWIDNIVKYFDYVIDSCTNSVLKDERKNLDTIDELNASTNLPELKKKFRLKRINDLIDNSRQILINQQNIIEKVKGVVINMKSGNYNDFDELVETLMLKVNRELL